MNFIDAVPVFSPFIDSASGFSGRTTSAPVKTRAHRSILKGSDKFTSGSRSCPVIQRVCFADGIAPSKSADAFSAQDTLRITKEVLEDFLRTHGLEDHFDEVNAWCVEMGAAFLEELRENFSEVLDALQLSHEEHQRMLVPPVPLETVHQIQRVCFADGIAPSKSAEYSSARDTLRITKEVLENFLRSHGLEDHFDEVNAWCVEMGAAFLEELRENFSEVLDALQLSHEEHQRMLVPPVPLETVHQIQVW